MTARPTAYYHIKRDGRIVARVVMYHITMDQMEATIPYYVSDGHTNCLRGNVLYPFICFSNTGGACPATEQYGRGLLLKYHVGRNISTGQISEYIYRALGRAPPDERSVVGLDSVLPRLKNLLDYLIAINGKYIVDYRPDRVKYYRPVHDEPEGAKYDMTAHSRLPAGSPHCKDTKEADDFRHHILESVRNQAVHMQKYSLIQVTYAKYDPVEMEDVAFNDKIDIIGSFERNAKNVEHYANISYELHKRFSDRVARGRAQSRADLTRFADKPQILDQVHHAMHFYDTLHYLLTARKSVLTDRPDRILRTNLRNWGCTVE